MGKNYNEAFKSTTIFGGVQVFTIIVGLIKNKCIAIILGSNGYGINSLYNSTINLIKLVSSLGIDLSGVKEISEAYQLNDSRLFSFTGKTLRFWTWLTGCFGTLLMIVFAPQLSMWTFQSEEYSQAYILLSPSLLFLSLSTAEITLLRGTRHIRDIAKASVISGIIGLIASIPLYYWFKNAGIIPAIILSAIISYVFTYLYSRKIISHSSRHSFKIYIKNGSRLVKLGILMTIGNVIGSLATYLVTLTVSNYGSISEVGLYNAGWGLTNQYVSLIFTAMVADYLPRLAAVNYDNKKVAECINDQAEIAAIILGPCLCLLMLALPFIIRLLFSKEFLSVVSFTRLFISGIFLQCASWAVSYVLLAKGEGKKYVITQIISSIVKLISMGGGYILYGLEGLGTGFILSNIVYLFYICYIAKNNYEFKFSKSFLVFFIKQNILLNISFLLISLSDSYYCPFLFVSIGLILCFLSAYISYTKLKAKISVSTIFQKLFKRDKK